jgi:hypothetical protein
MKKDDEFQQVREGRFLVDAECPQCGVVGAVGVTIDAVLKKVGGESTLGLRCKSKAVEHNCGQTQVMINADTGEVIA